MYESIRRKLHTRIKSNAFETIRVGKIPWMILHNDTRIKSYTYEKLHVWKVTRTKNYTYEKLHVLNIKLWLVHCYTRIDSFTELLIRVCFLTWNFSYVDPLPLFVHFGQPYNIALIGKDIISPRWVPYWRISAFLLRIWLVPGDTYALHIWLSYRHWFTRYKPYNQFPEELFRKHEC